MAGGRVLNVKHSATVRSSSTQSPRQVWDRVAQAAASSSSPPVPAVHSRERFPTLTASKATPTFRQSQHTTAWSAAGSSAPTSPPGGLPGVRPTTRSPAPSPQADPPRMSAALFPTLPSSGSSNNKPAVSGNQSLKYIRGETNKNAWGSKGEDPQTADTSPIPESHVDPHPPNGASKGKKKKGKEKQTLFTFGTFPT